MDRHEDLLGRQYSDVENAANILQQIREDEKYTIPASWLKREIEKEGIITSRLALGMPVGSTLDFIDEGTLSRAFTSRLPI